MVTERVFRRVFFSTSGLLFIASATVTMIWCASMSAMDEMQMPGDWTMSMVWMRMPGQSWPDAAASFLGMWVVMMAAMMLPSVVPMLWRYCQAVGKTEGMHNATWMHLSRLTAIVGLAYFFVWTGLGLAVFVLGVVLASFAMDLPAVARAVPMVIGVVVLITGWLQFTDWKAHHLACCREAPGCCQALPASVGSAWRHGLRLAFHCSCCCGGLTAILLVMGVMDLRAMAVVTTAITLERLAPAGNQIARAIGVMVVGAGLLLIARAVSGR